jgi:hypothetical protein
MQKLVHKKWSITVFSITALLLMLIILLNYIVDPLQFYHKAFYEPFYSKEQRYQLPGMAKNYDYDTIIIGSSMTENFIPSYIKRHLGFNALKLSISGSSTREQYLIANLAMQTGKVKNVIWGIDYFALRGEPTRVRDEQGPFPYYLYDQNPLNDIKYLLNIDTTNESINIITGQLRGEKREKTNLDLLYSWGSLTQFGRKTVLKLWENTDTSNAQASEEYESDNIKKNLRENVFNLVKNNPHINFYIYHPPYSILQHYYYYKVNRVLFENELYAKKYLFSELGSLKNVKIYDFQQDKNITFNLNNYKDLAHHSEKINDYIINAIAKNNYLVTKDNIDIYLKMLKLETENLKVGEL